MTNRAIRRLGALFVVLFAIIVVRQFWIALVEAPALDADPRNPRVALLAQGRGDIVASDGTVLAQSKNAKRVYPLGALVAHAVGYDSPRYGTSGLEDAFDRALTPRPVSADVLAQVTSLFGGAQPVSRGAEVITTLDVATQRALVTQLSRYSRAAGIVIEPQSGAVLALASVPGFDPNTIDADFPRLAHSGSSPLLDRSTSGLYPPGSTFKIITAADALEAGIVTPQSTFTDNGSLVVGNFTIHDDEGEVTGTQTLAGAFALSSNVDFGQIVLRLGVDEWYAAARRWGLGQPLEFDLPAARDRIPPQADVSPSILAQMGFGQASLLVSPLRMALVAATIANGGVTPRPYLVRAVRGNGISVQTKTEQLANPISPQTAATVRDMMLEVVRHGTGTAAALPNVSVAGKTGTATNPAGRAHSWFVAFAPAEAPRVAVAVVVENAGYGGAVAAPIARNVLRVALARRS
ncbi:MAG TPA: penicillin-binding protein 2 [Candidatus Binatia bacterium]|nr:penicillin-binding protein 2 [Candidatus Binatia bacterium]